MPGILLTLITSYKFYLAISFFISYWFVKEKIYYIPDISGEWEMELIYKQSKYIPYRNMRIKYKIFINQKDSKIIAKGEKISEKLYESNIKEYTSEEKTNSQYEGYIKRGFMNHRLTLNIEENGKNRVVVGQLNLNITSSRNYIDGSFKRRDAESEGIAILTR